MHASGPPLALAHNAHVHNLKRLWLQAPAWLIARHLLAGAPMRLAADWCSGRSPSCGNQCYNVCRARRGAGALPGRGIDKGWRNQLILRTLKSGHRTLVILTILLTIHAARAARRSCVEYTAARSTAGCRCSCRAIGTNARIAAGRGWCACTSRLPAGLSQAGDDVARDECTIRPVAPGAGIRRQDGLPA